ncbi:MAG TPA: TolC family protein [Vicinamibacteria bacterium]|nr:TolC family protein [Vicinamibacteria bacterium]
MKPFWIVLAAVSGLAAAGGSAEAVAETIRLTLAETIDRARVSSPSLARLAALQTAAEAGLRGARASRLPALDLGASYTRNSDVPELTIAVPGMEPRTIFPNIPDNYRTRAALSLPLYTGGRLEAGVRAAGHDREAAVHDLEGGANDLVLEATTAYWRLVTALETARVLAEAVAAFEAHLKETRDRQQFGMAARNEALAVQVERDRAELQRLLAVNAAQIANADLVRLTGLPAATRVEPIEPLADPGAPVSGGGSPGPAGGDAPACSPARQAGARSDAFRRIGGWGADEQHEQRRLDGLVAEALVARPEAAALRSRLAATEASVRVARSSSLPAAGLSAGYDYARPNTRILPPVEEWRGTWTVGVSVSITAFDGGRTAAAVARASALADAVRHQLEDLERSIRLEVTSRVLDLGAGHATLEVARRNLEAAREGVRVSGDRYREGLIPSSELLDAETALLRAGLEETEALAQLRLAQARLTRAVGR